MSISRRQFLRCVAGGSLAVGLAPFSLSARDRMPGGAAAGTTSAASGNPLRLPQTFTGDTIVAARATQRIWPDLETPVMTFGGSYPAPTFRVRSGEEFAVRLVNQLDEPTNIHWHGLVIPPDMDGHPKDAIGPGETFDYRFTVDQRAGTYWYHPHPHMMTGEQVYHGMAGLFIVEDDEEQSLDLPRGEFDVPLVVQDRRVKQARELVYELQMADHQNGYLGDTILVNGTPDPYLEVAAGLYRFRILNGSNARILNLGFTDNRTFHVIASDGGLLEAPVPVTYLYLAPAERVELLVDFSGDAIGSSAQLMSRQFNAATGDRLQQGTEMPIIRFDVTRAGTPASVPETLATVEKLDPASAARTRTFNLKIDHSTTPEGHTINDKVFDMERVDEQVRIGDMEIWTFQNTSILPHPMHLHGAQFQVLDRNGNAANRLTNDLGWKDTVYVAPFNIMRVMVRFGEWPGLLMVHCHNLEHEDHGMMLNFEMIPAVSSVEPVREPAGCMDLR